MEGVSTLVRENIEVLSSTQPSDDGKAEVSYIHVCYSISSCTGGAWENWVCSALMYILCT